MMIPTRKNIYHKQGKVYTMNTNDIIADIYGN